MIDVFTIQFSKSIKFSYSKKKNDDFALSTPTPESSDKIFDIIGQKLQLPKETEPLFTKMGLLHDFNGINTNQCREYIKISFPGYIDHILQSHGWQDQPYLSNHPTSPLPEDAVHKMYAAVLSPSGGGPAEHTSNHVALESKIGFSYRSLLDELIIVYVSCHSNIGYAVTTLSKFSTCPTQLHYDYLQGVVTYPQHTKNWGIRFHCTCNPASFHTNLPPGNFNDVPTTLPNNFPSFTEVNPHELTCYCNASYANNPRKQRSTTGYVITLAVSAIVYCSKTQTVTALSSTEAEFYAAVAASKVIMFLCSVLTDLSIPPSGPTQVYEDKKSCINVINAHHPTERT